MKRKFERVDKNEILGYIKLFTPRGWKSDRLGWADTVEDMFTQGYCFNFAKALKKTFEHKYDCCIVGTGVVSIDKDWDKVSKQIYKHIVYLEFNHFIMVVRDHQTNTTFGFDIIGTYDINQQDYNETIIKCNTYNEKAKLLDNLRGDECEFIQRYSDDGTDPNDYKVFWWLTEEDIEVVSKRMCDMEAKGYED